MASCRRPTNAMVSGVRSLEVNPFNTAESNLLVMYDGDAAGYDIFAGNPSHEGSYLLSARQGSGTAVCFVARNRFAVLLKENHIGIYNLQNELSKTFDSPTPCTAIHMGGNNRVMLRDDTKASLYDLTSRKIVAECSIPSGTRYVVWSPNMGYVAFLAKNSILCCTKNLEVLYTLHEHGRIKSACWDENNVLIYATHSHLKYCVPQAGDTAVLSSLASPVYLFRAAKGFVHYLDRSNTHHREKLATTEYLFKLALHQQRLDDVKTLLKSARLCGHVVIGYLKKRGHPEVALHFVEDPATRFNLALEYGHIEEAMPAAATLDDKTTWARLGREALRQGNQQVVEQVYQKTKNLEGLSFLYVITGNRGKLGKMLKIAERRNDVMSRYHNALLVGNVEERVKVLAEMGQVALAALTARTHGLEELAVTLEESLTRPVEQVRPDAKLLLPPTPLFQASGENQNWPVTCSIAEAFANSLANVEIAAPGAVEEPPLEAYEDAAEDPFGDDLGGAVGDADLGAWGMGDDLDLGDVPDAPVEEARQDRGVARGEPPRTKWLRDRKMPMDLVAAGEFGEALLMLERRIGLVNAEPLGALFKRAYVAGQTFVPGLPQAPTLELPVLASGSCRDRTCSPFVVFGVPNLLEMEKEAAKLTTGGKFADSLKAFQSLLQALTLAVATSSEEETRLHELIETCRQYVTGMRLECSRKELPPTEVARSLELVSYLTCCKLHPTHVTLSLRVAMSTAFKGQNFLTAAYFAKRLLQGSAGAKPNAELATQARKVLTVCESKASDAHQLNFDLKAAGPEGSLTICAGSFMPIPPTAATVSCPFCGSVFTPSYKDKLCPTCNLAKIGASTLGVQFRKVM